VILLFLVVRSCWCDLTSAVVIGVCFFLFLLVLHSPPDLLAWCSPLGWWGMTRSRGGTHPPHLDRGESPMDASISTA
jgi:hypothetical protein